MPCRSDPADYVDNVVTVNNNAPNHLLCEACALLEDKGLLQSTSSELRDWYTKHEKTEKARVRYEAALKFSERERRLFGINLAQLKREMEAEAKKKK